MANKTKQTIEIDATNAVELVKEKADSIGQALELRVNSDPTFKKASDFMGVVREAKSLLREKKKSILEPLKEAKANIELLFEPAEKKVGIIEIYLKDQIQKYNVRLLAEAKERAKEAEEKIEAGATMTEATRKLNNTKERVESIPTRKVTRIKIADFSKVPDEFKVLNESKALSAHKSGVEVSGLEFYVEEIIVNRF